MIENGDGQTTVEDLKKLVQKFCEERDWDQFHDIKELAIGLATESAELLDIMRFKTPAQLSELLRDERSRIRISEELADIAWMLLRFCQLHGFELATALGDKMKKNEVKYPVATSRGSNRKYNEPPS